MPIDYKKAEKDLYHPKTTPSIIDVPEMRFIAVDGEGDPNTSEAYKVAMEILYGLSYSIKMSKMGGLVPDGYFDYVVDISETRRHHEIYLSDPRKTTPEKLKTVIRHPIRKI